MSLETKDVPQDAYEAQQRWQQKQELDRECNALLDQKAILQAECQRFFEQKTELEQDIMKASTMMTQLTENLTRLKKQVQESDGAKDIRGMEVVMLQIQEQELRDNIEHIENRLHMNNATRCENRWVLNEQTRVFLVNPMKPAKTATTFAKHVLQVMA